MARSKGVLKFGFRRLVAGAAAAVAVSMMASSPAEAAVISSQQVTAVAPDMSASENDNDVRQYARWRRRNRGIFYAKEGGLADQEPSSDSSVHEAAKESTVAYGDKEAFIGVSEQAQVAQRDDDDESGDESDDEESDQEEDRLAAEELLREADEEAQQEEQPVSELETDGKPETSDTAPEPETDADKAKKKPKRSKKGGGGKGARKPKKKTPEEKEEDRKKMQEFASKLSPEEQTILLRIKSLKQSMNEAREKLVELRRSKNKTPVTKEQKAQMRRAGRRRGRKQSKSRAKSVAAKPTPAPTPAPAPATE